MVFVAPNPRLGLIIKLYYKPRLFWERSFFAPPATKVVEPLTGTRSPPAPLKKGGEDEKLAVYGLESLEREICVKIIKFGGRSVSFAVQSSPVFGDLGGIFKTTSFELDGV